MMRLCFRSSVVVGSRRSRQAVVHACCTSSFLSFSTLPCSITSAAQGFFRRPQLRMNARGTNQRSDKRKLHQRQLSFGGGHGGGSRSLSVTPHASRSHDVKKSKRDAASWRSVTSSRDGKATLLVLESGLGAFLEARHAASSDDVQRGSVHCIAVAGFDLDSTLIQRRNGGKSYERQDPRDWVFMSENVKSALTESDLSGSLVVVFTNQMQIRGAHDGKRATVFKEMVKNVMAELNLRAFVVLAATQGDIHRKGEGIGMWKYLDSMIAAAAKPLGLVDVTFKPDPTLSIFVGDAAGRRGDHSDADKAFAKACGMTFYTETDYFQLNKGEDVPTVERTIEIRTVANDVARRLEL